MNSLFCEFTLVHINTAGVGWQCGLRHGRTRLPVFDAFIFGQETARETAGFRRRDFQRRFAETNYRILTPPLRIHSVSCFLNSAFFFRGVRNG